ncbi:MAG TPA: NIL domain-containing protein [bacterium]|nr:NIL domain-containing protein [bacterium]
MEKRFVMHFPKTLVDKPIMSTLIRKYDLDFNILKAYVTPEEEGTLVLALSGAEEKLNSAIRELKDMGVGVQPIASDIRMVKELCTDCTACIPLCPVDALYRDENFVVQFDAEKCIACGLCIKGCPTKALVFAI